jgi:glyoxylase-like metal-dependent hydrolase (beta-lactamase superfamily II)
MTLAVAGHWFSSERYGDDVTLLWEPHVRLGIRCNIWHVRGRDRHMLVDSGMGVASLRQAIAASAEKPILCVASHSHFDHIGGHHEFADRAIHAAEADILAHPDAQNTVWDRYLDETTFSMAPAAGFRWQDYRITPAPATRILRGGDVIDLGGRSFEVLHLPGHSPGCIALWEAATGLMFSGDVVYDGVLYDDLYHSVPEEYVASLERLRSVPVRTVHGGHHGSFGRPRLLELIDEYIAGRRRPGCPGEQDVVAQQTLS